MTYPDTTRTLHAAIEAVENVEAATYRFFHTMNNIDHTLQNGIIIIEENTGTRMKDNGTARGRRGSSIRIQCYLRLDEIGFWLESAIGQGTTANFPDTTTQVATISGTPTGGTFTLQYGDQVTAGIAFDAAASAVESALEALSNLAPADVSVAGSAGGPYTITFPLLDPGFPNGTLAPYLIDADGSGLTGGTAPDVAITTPNSVSGAYLREWIGGTLKGKTMSLRWFNGLYWRKMKRARVNTMNIQGFGNALAMVDIELVGNASQKIADPTPITEDNTYVPMDAPMQSVRFDGTINADVDRLSLQINNNLTQRSPMDGSTSMGRTRFGVFQVNIDGMVDYPAYEGSLYEAFENNDEVGDMDLVMIDDLHEVGTGTPFNPYFIATVFQPLLADTTEGDDGGELVQLIRGRAMNDPVEGGGIRVQVANDKASSYYAGS